MKNSHNREISLKSQTLEIIIFIIVKLGMVFVLDLTVSSSKLNNYLIEMESQLKRDLSSVQHCRLISLQLLMLETT